VFSAGLRQILGPKPTRGDYATVLIAAPIGLVVDGLGHIHGLPSPGIAGLTFASVALGAKRALETQGKRRGRVIRDAHQLIFFLHEVASETTASKDRVAIEGFIIRLERQIKLCELKVTKPAILEEATAETVKAIDEISSQPSPSLPPPPLFSVTPNPTP